MNIANKVLSGVVNTLLHGIFSNINFDVGDTVYCISKKYDSMGYDTGDLCVVETIITKIHIEAERTLGNSDYIGTTVYVKKNIHKPNTYYASDYYTLDDFGESIFLSKKEAEKIIKELYYENK